MRLAVHSTIAAIGLVLLGLGASAMYVESSAYLIGGDTSVQRVARWTTTGSNSGWSIATQNVNLLDCANVLNAPAALAVRYLDDATRNALAPTCLSVASSITSNAPAASYAWYVEALAHAAMGDSAAMNEALRRSQLTGANEQWIAERRVELAENHFDELEPSVLHRHEADLSMLVLSERGIASIAGRYATDMAFRDRIVAIVETLSADNQQRFLNQVRSALSKSR